jgi:nucleotide-binding universal stress UspA family protein
MTRPSNQRKGMVVQLYLSVAHRTGSAEALELAEQLSAWHDEMVVHARAVARNGAAQCDDACPHARAVELWRAAREILGEAAERLGFLKAASLPLPHVSSARRPGGSTVHTTEQHGDPASVIALYANDREVDLIVMASER